MRYERAAAVLTVVGEEACHLIWPANFTGICSASANKNTAASCVRRVRRFLCCSALDTPATGLFPIVPCICSSYETSLKMWCRDADVTARFCQLRFGLGAAASSASAARCGPLESPFPRVPVQHVRLCRGFSCGSSPCFSCQSAVMTREKTLS